MPLTHKSSNESATEAGPRFRRYRSLAVAEVRQYLRNKTLLFMAVIFPIGVAFLVQFMGRSDQGGSSLIRTATSMEVFLLITLMFVQFYSVLSMASTRRDERVLKRLRTGEARDLEILTALATPGAIMTVTLTLLMTAILIAYTGDVPRSGVLLFLIVIFGIAISTALALLTSAITANAEAAQMTSLPVMALAMLSQSPLRSALPEQIQDPLSRTPFALIGDLTFIEWTGKPFGQNAGTSASGLASTIDQATHPLGLLLVWATVLAWGALRYMKWEINR
ncbi:ABC transporter permease [uncultured Corynebacterium sp.]|uniref:ABC transporter permease n=1 Tax=uncultured Corynebacterium sp. TaxID=159447 RepID=UPI0025FA4688|nr:ABC transporter permease [uncultured Corynebacterium sp.]